MYTCSAKRKFLLVLYLSLHKLSNILDRFCIPLGEKLDHYSWVKFRSESNGDTDSLNPLKRCLDPEMANYGLIWTKNQKILNFS